MQNHQHYLLAVGMAVPKPLARWEGTALLQVNPPWAPPQVHLPSRRLRAQPGTAPTKPNGGCSLPRLPGPNKALEVVKGEAGNTSLETV